MINTVYKLRKFQCLNNGFDFLEFKSNCLNDDDSLHIELLLKSNNSLFPLGTSSTQNYCFSPNTHKSSVASAPV